MQMKFYRTTGNGSHTCTVLIQDPYDLSMAEQLSANWLGIGSWQTTVDN